MLKNVKVTITHTSQWKGKDYEDRSSIMIEDAATGIRVLDIEMDTIDLARGAFRSFAARPADVKFAPDEHSLRLYGAKVEREEILVDHIDPMSGLSQDERRAELRRRVAAAVATLGPGWMVSRDGTSSRQDGKRHQAHAMRYVDPNTGNVIPVERPAVRHLQAIIEGLKGGKAIDGLIARAEEALLDLGAKP